VSTQGIGDVGKHSQTPSKQFKSHAFYDYWFWYHTPNAASKQRHAIIYLRSNISGFYYVEGSPIGYAALHLAHRLHLLAQVILVLANAAIPPVNALVFADHDVFGNTV
jgi:hypothetical protein